ncbi:UNVERIFIED_CONTAM: High affinity Ca2+/Mn2+ P-type ATPase-like protein [Siphonaria sp. JEL0065]|nr:High affinity Ca2+/Mn2+ P-type ATPase-like protein [Siphonaria sp. JEL0065]
MAGAGYVRIGGFEPRRRSLSIDGEGGVPMQPLGVSGSGGSGSAPGTPGAAFRPLGQPLEGEEQQQPNESPSAVFCVRSAGDTLSALSVTPLAGLSHHEVEYRRRTHGLNVLNSDDEAESMLLKFIEQFKNPMNLLLLASAAVSLAIGEIEDAVSITLAMVIVVTVAFVQEYRSEKSLEALNTLLPHYCKVVRNMTTLKILAEDLVPGDICHFSAGDRIPADLRLITANDLEIDESSLTGETYPRRKNVDAIVLNGGVGVGGVAVGTNSGSSVALADRTNIAFMGTLVRSGNCSGVVVGIGKNTEFGHVFTMMKEV